MAIVKVEPL